MTGICPRNTEVHPAQPRSARPWVWLLALALALPIAAGCDGQDAGQDTRDSSTNTDGNDSDSTDDTQTPEDSTCEDFCIAEIRDIVATCFDIPEGISEAECLEHCAEDGLAVTTDCVLAAGSDCAAIDACFEGIDSGDDDDDGNDGELPPVGESFVINPLTSEHGALSNYFSKYTTVFGLYIVATSDTPDAKVSHAASIMAEYLDNDEDGTVDDDAVIAAMLRNKATLVMFATQRDAESSGIFESNVIDGYGAQDLYGEETNPPGGFDAALEEVLHLISSYGYEEAHPDLSSTPTSPMTEAMDIARGGHFTSIPASYPSEAWYHYDDATCDYRCMAVEYFYWALTTLLGAQADRCDDIAIEWETCTPEQFQSTDVAMYNLLTNPQHKMPTVLPDGVYQGN